MKKQRNERWYNMRIYTIFITTACLFNMATANEARISPETIIPKNCISSSLLDLYKINTTRLVTLKELTGGINNYIVKKSFDASTEVHFITGRKFKSHTLIIGVTGSDRKIFLVKTHVKSPGGCPCCPSTPDIYFPLNNRFIFAWSPYSDGGVAFEPNLSQGDDSEFGNCAYEARRFSIPMMKEIFKPYRITRNPRSGDLCEIYLGKKRCKFGHLSYATWE